MQELSLIGRCELASVGVAGVRPATSQREVEHWDGAPPIFCNDDDNDDVTPNDVVNDEKVVFDPVNPSQIGYCIVTIRNYWYIICHIYALTHVAYTLCMHVYENTHAKQKKGKHWWLQRGFGALRKLLILKV